MSRQPYIQTTAMRSTLIILLGLFLIPLASVSAEVRSIAFPVGGDFRFRNDFAEPRGGGTREHLGIDIIASKMTPAVAATDGEIVFIAIPQPSWGYSITIRDAEGYTYRYLHLNNDTPGTDDGAGGVAYAYEAGLSRGSRVVKGQRIGWVGDSGNAESTVSHLHFEMRDPNRVVINPYETLLAASGNQTAGQSTTIVDHSLEVTPEIEAEFIGALSLSEGMVDPEVVILHTELTTLGFYSGTLGKVFNTVTREAVRRFQVAYKLEPNGIADELTRRRIKEEVKRKSLMPSPSPVSSAPSSGAELAEGATGEAVRALQERLKDLGYFPSYVTGYFGPITRTAVIAFQNANGIEPVGFVGPKTRAALDAAAAPIAGPPYVFADDMEMGARGEAVRELQSRLKLAGFFNDEPTGYFGSITRSSVIAFQNANGIEPLGIVGPKTRAALNAVE